MCQNTKLFGYANDFPPKLDFSFRFVTISIDIV